MRNDGVKIIKSRIEELEKRLATHENTHTPPGLKRGGDRIMKKFWTESAVLKCCMWNRPTTEQSERFVSVLSSG
ncbi:MAG: hypothetical protein ACXQTO_04245, partial [Candidatus Syntropharchaeales archaeon]